MKSLPKRRKKKDNPYTLLYEAESNRYFILFNDVRNVINKERKLKWNQIQLIYFLIKIKNIS